MNMTRLRPGRMPGITRMIMIVMEKNMRYVQVENSREIVTNVENLDTEQMHVGSKIQVRRQVVGLVKELVSSNKVVAVEAGLIKVVTEARMDVVVGDSVEPVTVVIGLVAVSKNVTR
jgi:hypothetical protein